MNDRLTIQLRADTADENLTLGDLSERLKDFNAALSALDQHVSVKNKPTSVFRVVDLSHSSPTAVTIGAFPCEDSLEDNSGRIIPAFLTAIELMNAGHGFESVPLSVLEPIYRIAKSLKAGIKEIRLRAETKTVFFTETIEKMLSELLEQERVNIGAIKGTIDYINVHRGTNTFRIYPLIGPSYVTCEFPTHLKEKAKEAIERYVTIAGKLHYKIGAQHPHRVDVDAIEIMPEEKELPTLASLRGIATGRLGESDSGWE